MKHKDFKELAPGVWENHEEFPRFSLDDVAFCIEKVKSSPTKRARICVHNGIEDRLQEMFIAFDSATYVRPSYHMNKDESFHMMEGYGKYVFFSDQGEPVSDLRLGPYDSDLPFFCRIPGNLPHSLIVYSDYAVAHEVTSGPFEKGSTVFPAWSPDLQTAEEQDAYCKHHAHRPADPVGTCHYERLTEEMCRAAPGLISVSRADLEYLKSEVNNTVRKRISLCIHQDAADLIHEMFVVYTDKTFVRAKLHMGKDESLHILEGEADFIFFNEDGIIRDVVQLGDRTTGKNVFVRVPTGVYHTIIVRSEYLIIHESTPRPLNCSNTLWADWPPLDSCAGAAVDYQKELELRVAAYLA
jgi:cupin fold WbuC family metalloprotein